MRPESNGIDSLMHHNVMEKTAKPFWKTRFSWERRCDVIHYRGCVQWEPLLWTKQSQRVQMSRHCQLPFGSSALILMTRPRCLARNTPAGKKNNTSGCVNFISRYVNLLSAYWIFPLWLTHWGPHLLFGLWGARPFRKGIERHNLSSVIN